MTKEIKKYLAFILALIEQNDPATDWGAAADELLTRIGFYQHERLVHLLVMLAFALFTAAALAMTFVWPVFIWLLILFVILLIPYIWHYYFLENAVQKLYRQYYTIREKALAQKRA